MYILEILEEKYYNGEISKDIFKIMALKIRLQRMGRKDIPFFRIVAAEESEKRGGKTVVQLGFYDPKTTPVTINVDKKALDNLLSKGAQPTESVRKLLSL